MRKNGVVVKINMKKSIIDDTFKEKNNFLSCNRMIEMIDFL